MIDSARLNVLAAAAKRCPAAAPLAMASTGTAFSGVGTRKLAALGGVPASAQDRQAR